MSSGGPRCFESTTLKSKNQAKPKHGARPVALTRTSRKADELRNLGAAADVATEEQDVVSEVKRLTDGKGAPS